MRVSWMPTCWFPVSRTMGLIWSALSRSNGSWQAKAGQGFDATPFQIDWTARKGDLSSRQTKSLLAAQHDKAARQSSHHIRFAAVRLPWPVPSRALCTHAKSGQRTISVRPQEQYEALQRARQRQKSPEFGSQYAKRAGIECAIGQGSATADYAARAISDKPKPICKTCWWRPR